jgi:hypothetical protein
LWWKLLSETGREKYRSENVLKLLDTTGDRMKSGKTYKCFEAVLIVDTADHDLEAQGLLALGEVTSSDAPSQGAPDPSVFQSQT